MFCSSMCWQWTKCFERNMFVSSSFFWYRFFDVVLKRFFTNKQNKTKTTNQHTNQTNQTNHSASRSHILRRGRWPSPAQGRGLRRHGGSGALDESPRHAAKREASDDAWDSVGLVGWWWGGSRWLWYFWCGIRCKIVRNGFSGCFKSLKTQGEWYIQRE